MPVEGEGEGGGGGGGGGWRRWCRGVALEEALWSGYRGEVAVEGERWRRGGEVAVEAGEVAVEGGVPVEVGRWRWRGEVAV